MMPLYKTRIQRSAPRLSVAGGIVVTAALLLCAVAPGYCQDDESYLAAPPVQLPATVSSDPEVSNVFNWQEVPTNQPVPIIRAVFDQGGYQLYDNVGETIVVRFKNNNLYVMKFGISSDGSTYFVNSGTSPILYLPQNGYLENATVDGARWYPFGSNFDPSSPVFLGIAPSWSDYNSIGWYPDMYCYGGYWCATPGGDFEPTVGLFIAFGSNRFNSWSNYGSYLSGNPAPYHLGYSNHNIYHYASRKYWTTRSFHGNGSSYGGSQGQPTRRDYQGSGADQHSGIAVRQFSGGGQPAQNRQTNSSNSFRGGSSNGSQFHSQPQPSGFSGSRPSGGGNFGGGSSRPSGGGGNPKPSGGGGSRPGGGSSGGQRSGGSGGGGQHH